MQYYDQRHETLKRIIKTIAIILTVILCIAGINFLVSLKKSEQTQISLSEQQEQQHMLILRPLYEKKSKLESQLADITNQRNHAVKRSTVFIFLLTDCSETLVQEFSTILQPYDCPAVICISDTSYPGAEGCISVEEAKELVERRWEFMIDGSSDVDRLNDFLQSYGLTKPVAIYNPNNQTDNKNINHALPQVYYGNQSDSALFNAVYGMQEELFISAANAAIENRTSIVMTAGTVLPRETYHKEPLQEILALSEITRSDVDLRICTYSENVALQSEYNMQQQKVFDETEAEYQSISESLRDIEAQIEKIEIELLE